MAELPPELRTLAELRRLLREAVGGDSRLCTREEAAEYCKISVETFDDWRAKGWLPPPLPGRQRWDKRAIDRMLDVQSGLVEANSDFAARRNAARKRQSG